MHILYNKLVRIFTVQSEHEHTIVDVAVKELVKECYHKQNNRRDEKKGSQTEKVRSLPPIPIIVGKKGHNMSREWPQECSILWSNRNSHRTSDINIMECGLRNG